jgi:bidirectional [NiFe] hydrogenase diaphorase subunit
LTIGPEWFASIGAPSNAGTKVFALSGKVRYTGLVEVPLGTPVGVVVNDIGGGAPDGHTVKAVQTGGPSGGCIPADRFDTPLDYESLRSVGSIMGSGGMIVLDDETSMVDVARFYMEFCRDESCGKCIPCRAGTVQIHRLLSKILDRQATRRDLALLESLSDLVRQTSLCGLGQTAPNTVTSTLMHFRNEYEALLQPDDGRVRGLEILPS